jgi:uncharacterized radical SAM superfamily Fe-S cluster-containing enzyme
VERHPGDADLPSSIPVEKPQYEKAGVGRHAESDGDVERMKEEVMESAEVLKKESQVGKAGTRMVRGETRPAFLNRHQPRMTYSGHPIREVPWTLPYWTTSLCPECKNVIKARKFALDGCVFMEKECPEHGYFRELLSNDVDFYMGMFTFRFGDNRGVANPLVHGDPNTECPSNCGVCNMHYSHTCMAIIDLVNPERPTIDQVRKMLQTLCDRKPVPCKVVQFSGGQSTIDPDFIEIVKIAKEMGFGQIQIGTNGKKMSDLDFARCCKDAGLDTVILQFEDVSKDVLKVIEVARQIDLRVVLAPTVIRGVNDHEVGEIVKFACDNADVITGVNFQPICFTSQIAEEDRLEQRYTITHLALDIEKQTNGQVPRENWLGLGCIQPFSRLIEAFTGEQAFLVSCHPDCGGGGYIFVNPDDHNDAKALSEFFNMREALIDIQLLSDKLKRKNAKWFNRILKKIGFVRATKQVGGARALRILKKHFNQKKAPGGLTFKRMLGVMDGSYRTVFVAGKHFQDVYNYDTERARRCIIHQVGIDGKMYPFCTYNSGPYYREKIEAAG